MFKVNPTFTKLVKAELLPSPFQSCMGPATCQPQRGGHICDQCEKNNSHLLSIYDVKSTTPGNTTIPLPLRFCNCWHCMKLANRRKPEWDEACFRGVNVVNWPLTVKAGSGEPRETQTEFGHQLQSRVIIDVMSLENEVFKGGLVGTGAHITIMDRTNKRVDTTFENLSSDLNFFIDCDHELQQDLCRNIAPDATTLTVNQFYVYPKNLRCHELNNFALTDVRGFDHFGGCPFADNSAFRQQEEVLAVFGVCHHKTWFRVIKLELDDLDVSGRIIADRDHFKALTQVRPLFAAHFFIDSAIAV